MPLSEVFRDLAGDDTGLSSADAARRLDKVGAAMDHNGTEVAKGSAEMVLTDDNFATIVNAVKEGRTVDDKLRKALLSILPTNGGEALVILLVFQMAFTCLPTMQSLFGTAPIDPATWAPITLVASSVFWLVEIEKALVRRARPARARTFALETLASIPISVPRAPDGPGKSGGSIGTPPLICCLIERTTP
jgi:magnesium-transporting ATPase (P-type)